jgi:hypothetical protein
MATSNLWFVSAAFAVTWVMFIGYFVHVRRSTRRAQAMLDAVSKANLR